VNKSDLIESVSNATAMTRHEPDDVVDAMVGAVTSDPQTAAPVKIVAGNGMGFGPAGALQAAVRAPVRVATKSTRKTVGQAPA